MKKRSRTEIIYQILQILLRDRNGVRITEIMYGSFLSFKPVKQYLMLMIHNDLVQYIPETQTFKLTQKGHRFLELYEGVSVVMQEPRQLQQ